MFKKIQKILRINFWYIRNFLEICLHSYKVHILTGNKLHIFLNYNIHTNIIIIFSYDVHTKCKFRKYLY